MSRGSGIVRSCLLSPALVLTLALSASAQAPAPPSQQTFRGTSLPCQQVMMRQLGFESQQQGYASKVQGAASQNIVWVEARENLPERPRRSWFGIWRGIFDLFD